MDQNENTASPEKNTLTLNAQLAVVSPTFLIIVVVLFLLHRLRPLSTVLFPKEEGKWHYGQPSLFTWITSTWKSSKEDLFHHAGPDGLMLFVFFEMVFKFFLFATIVCSAFILPVHVFYEENRSSNSIYTIASVNGNPNIFFIHLFVAWILVIAFYFFLYRAYRQVIFIQKSYLLRPSIAARTILVSGIDPKGKEEDLKEYFNSLKLGEVEHVTIVHHSKKLSAALAERWKWIQQIESLAAKDPDNLTPLLKEWLENDPLNLDLTYKVNSLSSASLYSKRQTQVSSLETFLNSKQTSRHPSLPLPPLPPPSTSVSSPPPPHQTSSSMYGVEEGRTTLLDTSIPPAPPPFWRFWERMPVEQRLNYFFKMFVLSDRKVQEYRSHYSQLSAPLPVAMITFKHPASTTLATQCILHPDILKFDIQRIPEPQDLNFPNLGLSPFQLIYRRYLHMLALILLILLWSFPVAAMNALFNLEKIGQYIPELEKFILSNPILSNLASSILPTLGVTIFMALLPMILYAFSSYRRFPSISRISLSVFGSFFLFQFFLVFLLFSLSSPFYDFKTIQDALSFDSVTKLLANSLPNGSMFFMNYIILHIGSVLPMSLIPIGSMVMYILFPPKTPRQKSAAHIRPLFLPSELTFSVLIWIIGFVYSIICPVMLLPCLLYTGLVWFVWRYRLLYQLSMVDSRGRLFVYLCKMWTVAPFFFLLLLFGTLSLKKFKFSMFLLPLLLFNIGALFWTSKACRKLVTIPLDLWRMQQPPPVPRSSNISIGTIKVHRVPIPTFQCQTGIDGMPLSFGQTDVQGSLPNVWLPPNTHHFGV